MPGTVTQLHAPRAATRLGPREARVLAQRARDAGLAPGAARALLAHLLRVCDPRHGFERSLPHRTPPGQDRVTGLADELGVSLSTLIRAVHALERAGLIAARRGTGRTWSTYTLQARRIVELLGEVPGSPWVTLDSLGALEGCQSDTPGVSKRHPRGVKTTPPYVRAREKDLSKTSNPPSPATSSTTSAADDNPSPPASGQGPLSEPRSEQASEHGSEHDRCEHGRTRAQGGCRLCGTTGRERARLEQQATREAEHTARVAEQLRAREAAAARRAQAAPLPADFRRTVRDAARAATRTPAPTRPTEKGSTR